MSGNFKIGDKVIIRNDLRWGEFYDEVYFDENMEIFKGITATLREQVDEHIWKLSNDLYADLHTQISEWNFSEEMFVPYAITPFDISRVYSEKIAIHCPTREMAKVLFEFLADGGFKWTSGSVYSTSDALLRTAYVSWGDRVCFSIEPKGGHRGCINDFLRAGFKVLEFEDYSWTLFSSFENEDDMECFLEEMMKT